MLSGGGNEGMCTLYDVGMFCCEGYKGLEVMMMTMTML